VCLIYGFYIIKSILTVLTTIFRKSDFDPRIVLAIDVDLYDLFCDCPLLVYLLHNQIKGRLDANKFFCETTPIVARF
jgi:hypothetical protein